MPGYFDQSARSIKSRCVVKGDARSQDISTLDIDPDLPEYATLSTKWGNRSIFYVLCFIWCLCNFVVYWISCWMVITPFIVIVIVIVIVIFIMCLDINCCNLSREIFCARYLWWPVLMLSYVELCVRNMYLGQGQVITSLRHCGM